MKQIGTGAQSVYALRVLQAGEGEVAALRDGDFGEGVVLMKDVDVLAGRRRVKWDADTGGAKPEDGQAVGIAVGKRFQEECAGDTKNGGVCADAEARERTMTALIGFVFHGGAAASARWWRSTAVVIVYHQRGPPDALEAMKLHNLAIGTSSAIKRGRR